MFYAWRLVKQELVLNNNKLCVDSKKTSAFQNTIFTPVISPLTKLYEPRAYKRDFTVFW